MATEKQKLANQRNAQKSTGPKTEEGKKKVSLNATRHGLLSTNPLVPGEDMQTFEVFTANLFQAFCCEGRLEFVLVKRIIDYSWRLERISKVEAALYMQQRTERRWNGAGPVTTAVPHQPQLREEELDEMNPGASELGNGFIRGADSFLKLQRYEAHLQRSIETATHELERLQCARSENIHPHFLSRRGRIPVLDKPTRNRAERNRPENYRDERGEWIYPEPPERRRCEVPEPGRVGAEAEVRTTPSPVPAAECSLSPEPTRKAEGAGSPNPTAPASTTRERDSAATRSESPVSPSPDQGKQPAKDRPLIHTDREPRPKADETLPAHAIRPRYIT